MTATRDLVLVGAGHTHLLILNMWARRPIAGVRLTLVSAGENAAYSGMLPGTLAGLYPPEAMLVPLGPLVERAGGTLIVDTVVGLNPRESTLELRSARRLPYDAASINIGSVPAGVDIWRRQAAVISVKPMHSFVDRFQREWESARRRSEEAGTPLTLVLVGAGAAGVELALCLDRRFARAGERVALTLVDGGTQILSGYLPRFVARAERELARRGVEVRLGTRAVDYKSDPGRVLLEDGSECPADLAIWVTQAAPPPMLDGFDLPRDDRGFLAVKRTLQSLGGDPVFITGDTAGFLGQPVPKAGVYAVREAPILWTNLQHHFSGKRLIEYDPQRGFLSLVGTGDRRALLQYRGYTSHSRWAWWLKDWIDRRFVRQFQ